MPIGKHFYGLRETKRVSLIDFDGDWLFFGLKNATNISVNFVLIFRQRRIFCKNVCLWIYIIYIFPVTCKDLHAWKLKLRKKLDKRLHWWQEQEERNNISWSKHNKPKSVSSIIRRTRKNIYTYISIVRTSGSKTLEMVKREVLQLYKKPSWTFE